MTETSPTLGDALPVRRSAVADVGKWIAAGVVAVMVILSFVQVRKPTAQLGDFGAYYRAGQAVVADRSPYTLDAKYGAFGRTCTARRSPTSRAGRWLTCGTCGPCGRS